MRRRIATVWLLLALLPYLGFTLLGAAPHRHRTALPTGGTTAALFAAGPVVDDCPICQWQHAALACGPLEAALAPVAAGDTSALGSTPTRLRAIPTPHAPRGPPAEPILTLVQS